MTKSIIDLAYGILLEIESDGDLLTLPIGRVTLIGDDEAITLKRYDFDGSIYVQ